MDINEMTPEELVEYKIQLAAYIRLMIAFDKASKVTKIH